MPVVVQKLIVAEWMELESSTDASAGEGQELSPEEVAKALKDAVTRGEVFPVACGVASNTDGGGGESSIPRIPIIGSGRRIGAA